VSLWFLAYSGAFAQDVTFDLKVLEMERTDWNERRVHWPSPKPNGFIDRSGFVTHVPAGVARALAATPDTAVIHRILLTATNLKPTQITMISREVGLEVRLIPQLLANREMAVDLRVNLEVRRDPEPAFTTDTTAQIIRVPEGESIIAGGFLTDLEAATLQRNTGFKENPILRYLFSEKRGRPEEPEIVVMLSPRNVEWPDVPAPKITAAEPAPFLYTVQVAAYRTAAAADRLVAELKKRYDSVLVRQPAASKLYRVSVGSFEDLTGARQAEARLRSEGFDTLVLRMQK